MRLAILRQQADAETDGGARTLQAGLPAMQLEGDGARRVGANDGAKQLGAARPGKAANPQNLALVDVKVDVGQHAAPRQAAHRQGDAAKAPSA